MRRSKFVNLNISTTADSLASIHATRRENNALNANCCRTIFLPTLGKISTSLRYSLPFIRRLFFQQHQLYPLTNYRRAERLLGIYGSILTHDPSDRIDIYTLTDEEYSQLATAIRCWPRITVESLFLDTSDGQYFDLMHRTNFAGAWQGIDMPASLSAFY